MEKAFFKRKQMIVDRVFQYRLVSLFLAAVLISLVLFSGLAMGGYWLIMVIGKEPFQETLLISQTMVIDGQTVSEQIEGVSRWSIILPAILINNIITMLVLTIVGIIYSHRISGPVYRIHADITRVLQGESGIRTAVRKGDYLQDFAKSVNQLIERLEES